MNAKYLAFSRMPRLWVTYSVQNKHPFLEISVRQLRESVKTLRRFRDGLCPHLQYTTNDLIALMDLYPVGAGRGMRSNRVSGRSQEIDEAVFCRQ